LADWTVRVNESDSTVIAGPSRTYAGGRAADLRLTDGFALADGERLACEGEDGEDGERADNRALHEI
jgi:hypothetical protein